MLKQPSSPYVYLYQPTQQLLLLSRGLQTLCALPDQQRICPPQRWFKCYSSHDQQRLKLACLALQQANPDDRLQFSLTLSCRCANQHTLKTEHRLCIVRIAKQRFICGRVSPTGSQVRHHQAIAHQYACWSAHPSAETSQYG